MSYDGAIRKSNRYATAISFFDPEKGADDFKLVEFRWLELRDDLPTSIPWQEKLQTHTVTRAQIQDALVKMLMWPSRPWQGLARLRPLLLAVDPEKRRSQVWLEAARAAAKVTDFVWQQYSYTGNVHV